MDRKLIIAHRGASNLEPENTIAAFQKAIDFGADMVELDIRQTKDQALVVIHDADFRGQPVKNINLAELKALSQNQVPTLEEVLRLIAGKIKLNAELKESGYERRVGELLLRYLSPADVIVTSFSSASMLNFKRDWPELRVGLIVGTNYRDFVKIFKLFFLPGYVKNFDALMISIRLWAVIRNQILRHPPVTVFPWVTDEADEIKKYLQDPEFAGVITNKPDLAINILNILNHGNPQ